MKLLYIGKKTYNNKYKSLYKSYNIETIHYTNSLKAVDNFHEIKPDIIFIKKKEFPRLWKIVLTSLRELYDEEESIFILEGVLDDSEFKAFNYLKGNISINDADKDINTIKEIIIKISGKEYLTNTYYPLEGELCIGFVKPNDFSFISGNIKQLDENQLIFTPENADDSIGIELETIISEISINKGNEVVTTDIEIINLGNQITCKVLGNKKNYLKLINNLFV